MCRSRASVQVRRVQQELRAARRAVGARSGAPADTCARHLLAPVPQMSKGLPLLFRSVSITLKVGPYLAARNCMAFRTDVLPPQGRTAVQNTRADVHVRGGFIPYQK